MPFTTLRETPRDLEPKAAERVAEKRVREFEVKLDAMENSVLTLKDVIIALGKEQSEKERSLGELRDTIVKLEEHIDSLVDDREKSHKQLQELRLEIIKQDGILEQTHGDLDHVNDLIRVAHEKLIAIETDAKRVIEAEKNEVRIAQENVSAADEHVYILTKEMSDLQLRIDEGKILEQRIPVLQEKLLDFEKQLEQVQALLEVTREERQKIENEKELIVVDIAAKQKAIQDEMISHTSRIEQETSAIVEREYAVGLREKAVGAREERLSAKIEELKLKFPIEMAKLAL